MAEILVMDDDVQFNGILAQHLQDAGHGVSCATTLREGVEKAGQYTFDVIFLDVGLPDGSGLDALPDLTQGALPPEVIIITGFDDAQSAELAIQCGAWDFVHKRQPVQAMMLSLNRALQYRESRKNSAVRVAFHMPELVGRSASFRGGVNLAAQAASSDVNVLIDGESGTGKGMLAMAIHENSRRSARPFIVVDCAALPENLIGSVIFGHEKGAFTGADRKIVGLAKQADGGTLFLDEIGDLPLEIQRTFLRVLQDHRFRPLGSQNEIGSDFRLIAATNRDLDRLVEEGSFRADLLFRLRMLTISLPPLRDRMDDVPVLAQHFVSRECAFRGGKIKGMAEDFLEALSAYRWPGNVRELSHAIAGAVAKATNDPLLFAMHLPAHIRIPLAKASSNLRDEAPAMSSSLNAGQRFGPLRELRDEFERAYLGELKKRSHGDIETACRLSGLSRPHIYALLRKHNLKLR